MLLLPDSSTQALIVISAVPVKFVFQGFIIKNSEIPFGPVAWQTLNQHKDGS